MVDIIVKRKFTVIGKMGEGLATEGSVWIPPLWKEANSKFAEISNLAKLNSDGSIVGIWGAMSDVDGKFERWRNEGKYLAGCEVLDDAEAPHGWVKWIIPSFKYVVVKCNLDSYKETFNHIMEDYLPSNSHILAGAVQEFYDPKDNNGELSLFFPIEKI
ncbi:AraC family transcriptional regulator [Paenibacillus tyrfis]|uniref:GyrI-like domain-containing protein n=1 Tax=Paenibacillus tyrfis TaxID=1501230 RepID=UPI0024938BE9|nr:GyrI-like domain-containing protein [Paenibacillus tyrfis]GLI10060.1 AraC family transcriptional regulator [Paenibacillus tyrfis]